jgi:hypothetical protein
MATLALQVFASIGFNLLTGLLNPVKTEGPRAGQGDTPTSQYGAPISRYWGRGRGAGALIWAIDKQEFSSRQGGKGQERTVYRYTGSFAYCIGHGELELETIFLNNKVWWSVAEGVSPEQLTLNSQRSALFTFYPGTTAQLPDPLIQSYRGVNRTPAYRGFAYIVFKGLPLEEFGNTFPVPNFVVRSKEGVSLSILRRRKGLVEGVGYSVRVSAYDNTGTRHVINTTTPNAVWGMRVMNVHPVIARYPRGEVQLYGPDYTKTIAAGREWGKAGNYGPGSITIEDISPGGLSEPSTVAASTTLTCAREPAPAPASTIFWSIQYTRGDGVIQTVNRLGVPPFRVSGPDDEAVTGATPESYFNNPDNFTSLAPPEPFTDRIITSSGQEIVNDPGGILGIHGWTLLGNPIYPLDYGYPTTGAKVAIIDCQPNTTVEPSGVSTASPLLSTIVEFALLACGIKPQQYDLSGIATMTAVGYKLTSVQSAKSFLEALQSVYLFTLTRSGGRISAAPYGASTVVESGLIPLLATENDDATPGSAYESVILDPSSLPVTLQLTYSSTGRNLQASSQIARRYRNDETFEALTSALPLPGENRNAYKQVDTQAVFDENVALTRSYQMLSILLGRRRSYTWAAPMRSLHYNIGDVLSGAFPYGLAGYEDRILIESIDLGNDYSLRIKGSSYDETFKSIDLTTESAPTVSVGSASGVSSNAVVLDIPIWRLTNSDSVLFAGAYGATSGWRGAGIYASIDDGSTFSLAASTVTPVTLGDVTQPLLPLPDNALVDVVSKLRIAVPDGAGTQFASISQSAFDRQDSNFVLVGKEIIQYQTATLVGPREYELTTIRRGWYGTWVHLSSHLPGELAVALNEALVAITVPTGELNQVLVTRFVSEGQQTITGTNLNVIPRGNSLRALPVVNIRWRLVSSSGDMRLDWNRVARKTVAWVDYTDVPLNESIEQYAVEILSATGQLLRTFTVSSSTLVYSHTERVADTGSLLANFNVRIYQVTPIVGRGFESQLLIQP